MAVALFPLCEGETLGSNFGRYAEFLGLKSTARLRVHLFGYVGKPSAKLPSSISRLAEQARDYWNVSGEYIVKNHTEFWYATRVVSPSLREEILKNMLCPPERGSAGRLSAYGRGFDCVAGLRYCEDCLAEWRCKGIEPYWKVGHQLPGVYYCEEHLTALKVVDPIKSDRNLDLTVRRCKGALDRVIVKTLSQSEVTAIKYLAKLSASKNEVYEIIPLEERYRDLLRCGGFLRPDLTIKRDVLVAEWMGYFGSEYCHLSGINMRRIMKWSFGLQKRAGDRQFIHPFMFVAAESFLENRVASPGSFVPAPRRKLIPVKGGSVSFANSDLLPCSGVLHRRCDTYTAEGLLIRSGGWKVVCSCGISYRVKGASQVGVLTMTPFAYGARYRRRFNKLLEMGLCPKKAALELNIGESTGLAWAHRSRPEQRKPLSISEIQKLRGEWRRLIDKAPLTSRISSAQRENPRVYEALRKDDHAWFVRFNRSHRSWRTEAPFHINGVDLEGDRVRKAYFDIMRIEPPVRASRGAILERAGLPLHLASESYARSPLWAELTESREDHRERVISWIGSMALKYNLRRGNRAIDEMIRGTGLAMKSFTAEQKARIRGFVSQRPLDDV
ncbi:TnsD family Tn7-like transposition protein [Burkholderia stagnalis]|uniref:TnsD family Tn7-like transposition protein n=1 Tax=Burkholderia stagnalis TaxID=1503054 RepID=UPI0009BD4BBA|nr:TnsD family Tn7-like transposition protein [Burkholderia stagnalis]